MGVRHLIWRTMAALRLRWLKYSKTPRSSMSFQMAPWPPGFIMGASGSGSSHCPSSALTTGTIGCSKSLQETKTVTYTNGQLCFDQ